MKFFAPVLIPTLDRYSHFKECIESLLMCTHVDKTDLFIALDYPLKEVHWKGYNKIANYVTEIKGFKSVTIIKREVNFGVRENILDAREKIFKQYDRLILSEDDNVFSPDFLDFINQGLEVYKDRKDILSITGYQYPVSLPQNYKQDVYLFSGFSAWGYGIWKDKWDSIDWNIEELRIFLNNKTLANKLLSKNLIKGLNRIVETGNITGDTYIAYYQNVNNMYSVFPVISRVRNNGHDGTGIHGGNDPKAREVYSNQPISDGTLKIVLPIDIMPDETVIHSLRRHFNPPLIRKIINNPDVLLNRIKGLIQKFFTLGNQTNKI